MATQALVDGSLVDHNLVTDSAAKRSGHLIDLTQEASTPVDPHTYRWLGAAFLLQAIASAVSGLLLAPVDLLAPAAPDDMAATMKDIAANETLLRASIVGEMVTAGGIIALGVLLFVVLRKHGTNIARVALGLYLVEAALLAIREVFVYGLWWTSQEAVNTGTADTLTAQATMLFESQSFAYSLHTLAFAAGATIFYALLARADILPRGLIALGLIAAPLAFFGTIFIMMGVEVPLIVFLPNLPFELGAGLWLVFRGRGS